MDVGMVWFVCRGVWAFFMVGFGLVSWVVIWEGVCEVSIFCFYRG